MLANAEYLATGIVVYRDVFKSDLDLKSRLESIVATGNKEGIGWNEAYTGYGAKNLKYRDCSDFKVKYNSDKSLTLNYNNIRENDQKDIHKDIINLWQDAYSVQQDPVNDYINMFGLAPLKYWESFNFIQYNPSQHFQIHSDHGYSYTCVLSSVGYLNDDYEGGELYFDKLNLKIKPKAGDLYLFPSSYIYSHAAMPVTSGTKYSIVTMLDYLETAHTPEYREIESKYSKSLL
jgi:hypothetical protein